MKFGLIDEVEFLTGDVQCLGKQCVRGYSTALSIDHLVASEQA